MAKLCSSYGSSPNTSYFHDLMFPMTPIDDLCNNEYATIKPDPTELFEELNLNNWPSIYSDIQKIESDNAAIIDADDFELDTKPEIRNIDCMWSASTTTSLLSTSAGSSIGGDVTAMPLAAVTGNTQNISNNNHSSSSSSSSSNNSKPIVVVANNSKLQNACRHNIKQEIKAEPSSDDYEQQLQQHSIPNSRTAQQQSMQHIPPGTSLLRKSNTQSQQQHKKLQQHKYVAGNSCSIQIPKMFASEFLRERDQLLSTTTTTNTHATSTLTNNSSNSTAMYVRPETPHSLDDDNTNTHSHSNVNGFKHNVDLRACVMGSNNISLTATDPTNYINHVSQELQDTSKNHISVVGGCTSLTDVLDVIVNDNNDRDSGNSSACSSSITSSTHLRNSDCDSDEESTAGSSCDSASSLLDGDFSSFAATSPVSSSNSSSSHHHHNMHSDHSYTRCKDGMDDLGNNLETPSDSDEEIDVVSIGDKKLPTNPSDKDRRALQTKVAYKFSNARIVKTANGVRTIPPRRRVSYELPYTPASSSPVKSVVNSRYPSPASTPYQYATSKSQQHMLSMLSDGTNTPINDKTRKRLGAGHIVNGIEYALPPNKKHRGKKSSKHHSSVVNMTIAAVPSPVPAGAGILKPRHYSIDEAADTAEKRNLHNDMERQRRIGLKNLFEALKKQIPSIKDKERAPKVNILREAAKLCENLTREDQQLNEQKAQLREQLKKRQELLARLRAMQRD